MPIIALAFLIGVSLFQQLTQIASILEWGLVGLIALILILRRAFLLAALFTGWFWAGAFALLYSYETAFAPELEGRELNVRGVITSLPQVDDRRVRFDFKLTDPLPGLPSKLKLSWYHTAQSLRAGQHWRLFVKLKPPHGLMNPGGFDYEQWLFTQGIGAIGYVRQPESAQLLAEERAWQSIPAFRQSLTDHLSTLKGLEFLGLLKALTIGQTDAITDAQWQILRQTGTIHLIAISGSHISLLAGLVYFLTLRVWIRLPLLSVPPQKAAAIVAIVVAVFYALLAGFAAPVQRALIMLAIAMLAIIWQRHVNTLQILSIALISVLIWNPFTVLAPGFWLSFVAVALIFYVLTARLHKPKLLSQTFKIHAITSLGMIPLVIGLFQQFSLIAPLANFIAVPIITLVIVPFALVGVLLLYFSPLLAQSLFSLLDFGLHSLWLVLQTLSEWQYATITGIHFSVFALALASLGIIILFMPKGLPGRYLGLVMGLPLFLSSSDTPRVGELRLTLLDVGQGLSVVVQTYRHVLVYDTGLKFSANADSGSSVLLPFLAQQQIKFVDGLIISHGDNDHIGGAESLLTLFSPEWILTSVPDQLAAHHAANCIQGQQWQWDGVNFMILSPGHQGFERGNDNSCVLRISTAYKTLLLTGDIEQTAEQWLVETNPEQLKANILIAPHHGSNTSSSMAFLEAVMPELILIPAGFHNQFNFPHSAVLARYQNQNIPWLNVAEQGAIRVSSDNTTFNFTFARKLNAKYWN